MPHLSRRASREAALVELQRLHAAIQASRAKRGVAVEPVGRVTAPSLSSEAAATRELTRRLQTDPLEKAESSGGGRSRWVWLGLAAAAVVIAAGLWAWRPARDPQSGRIVDYDPPTPAPAAPTAAPQPPDQTTAPVAAPPPAPVDAPVDTAPAPPVRITLDTIRPVWMRVMVDGTRALEREVAAGEHLTFDATARIVVRAGDGGGVRASMNGVDRGPLGRDGWPITVPFAIDAAPGATSPPPE